VTDASRPTALLRVFVAALGGVGKATTQTYETSSYRSLQRVAKGNGREEVLYIQGGLTPSGYVHI